MNTENRLLSISANNELIAANVQKVYEAGKQAGGGGGSSVWDMVTNKGTRVNGTYQFAYWNMLESDGNVAFNPPYDLKPTIATGMFGWVYSQIDLQAQFEKSGKVLDFSNCTIAQQCFYGSQFTRLGVLNFSKCANLNNTCGSCGYLTTIDGIIFSESINYNFTNTFSGCTSLSDVVASGSLATSGLNLSACPLTRESKLSFLNVLKHFTDGSTHTITFGAGEALTDEDRAIATEKGWTVVE